MLEDVIAERTLQVLDDHGSLPRTATVRIERPRQCESGEWQCRVQIVGLFDDRVWGGALGLDAVQALQLVMLTIGSMLETSKEGRAGRLRFEGESDLGFPLHQFPDEPPEDPTSPRE
jgi:hypothetical protein